MEKIPKRTLSTIVFLVFLVFIIASSLFGLEKQKENELLHQKFLAEQKAQKENEDRIYLMGKFDPSKKKDFTIIPNEYNVGGYQMFLRKEALAAFAKMAETAKKDAVILKIASATRNFDYQKNIWNNKWTGYTLVEGKNLSIKIPNEIARFKKILEYSAVPGTSRHHWGTDIDINNANPEYFTTKEGEKVYAWLIVNAPFFGFCQPYTLKGAERPTGYYEEKWHWSYLPLSKNFTEEYIKLIDEKEINGFLGDQYVLDQNIINDYVLGINPGCF